MRKSRLVVGSLAVAAIALSIIPAQAADSPGLVPKGSWNSGVKEITIGLEAPMTGVFAVLGVSQKNSMSIVADQINKAGGIGGATVKIKDLDDGLAPAKAVANAKEFATDDNVKMVVGPSITAYYQAAAPAYEAAKKINCQAAVAAGNFADYKYGFRSQDYYKDDINAMLAVLQDKGVKSFGMIYEAGATGNDFTAYMATVAPQYGMVYIGWQQITSTQTSHNDEVKKFIDADAIWISSNAYGALTAKAAKALNYKGLIVGGSGLQNVAFHDAGGADFAGTYMAAPNYQWPVRDKSKWMPGYKAHIDAIVAAYGINTGAIAGATSPKGTALAADCLYAYAVAANKAQSFDAEKVLAAMSTLDIPADQTPSGNRIHPGPEHNFYQADAIHIYKWMKDANGWYTEEQVKDVVQIAKVVAATKAKAKAGDACTKAGATAKSAAGKTLKCTKVKGKLVLK
ncbi:unannotated protein [freshwater metagenome]|uniref:Unannotated protein n=1 Tax=freshwater metagenome TaxID=449393 RepID=A0A6J7UZ87_9ZZZZ|nr:ABC transporter substrate-binding protein [Actinomycetota bacterium]MSY51605.1 ABC transporter substrate-binding protein [Actinomycetota bacterium]MSY88072.1 ABC transporter substrate-binding protein [Actinomycetota bacterium]MTA50034.1 ABC transporter substrate-binding protein [Actinomycetota bacterium]